MYLVVETIGKDLMIRAYKDITSIGKKENIPLGSLVKTFNSKKSNYINNKGYKAIVSYYNINPSNIYITIEEIDGWYIPLNVSEDNDEADQYKVILDEHKDLLEEVGNFNYYRNFLYEKDGLEYYQGINSIRSILEKYILNPLDCSTDCFLYPSNQNPYIEENNNYIYNFTDDVRIGSMNKKKSIYTIKGNEIYDEDYSILQNQGYLAITLPYNLDKKLGKTINNMSLVHKEINKVYKYSEKRYYD